MYNFETITRHIAAAVATSQAGVQKPRAQQQHTSLYDAVRSQKARCEAAPDNPKTGHTYDSRGTEEEAALGNFGGAATSEKREDNKHVKRHRVMTTHHHHRSHDSKHHCNSLKVVRVYRL